MTGFASTWANAPVDGDSNTPPEPGHYNVTVQDAKAFTSKAGNEVLVVELRILEGPNEGYIYLVLHGFKTEAQTRAAKRFANDLGVDVAVIESLDQLDTELKAVIGTYYSVEVSQYGDYRNTFVNEKLTGDAPVSDVPNDNVPTHAPAADDDTDIPF